MGDAVALPYLYCSKTREMKMNKKIYIPLILMLLSMVAAKSQIVSLGYKQQEKGMFQFSFNYPFVLNRYKPYEVMLGIDYTINNRKAPSGLGPQATFHYYLLDNANSNYLLGVGVSAGYLFDFNKGYANQLRFSPHLYFEYGLLCNLRAGYDLLPTKQRGYPYISIGIGGLHLMRRLRMM